jgi:hypothetical protein
MILQPQLNGVRYCANVVKYRIILIIILLYFRSYWTALKYKNVILVNYSPSFVRRQIHS